MERELSLLRVTLEALSPLMIASGAEDELHDVLLVRDANGLPTIPATSIAGAIRALVVEEQQGQWFGAETHQIRQRSAVTFTDGLFHWSDNSPRDGLALGSMKRALLDDVLCKLVVDDAEPLLRQHVRLNEYGVVDRTGKFSRTAIPAGARFTFEIRTEIRAAADEIERLLKLGVWLGGATRSGYGQMACVAFGREQFLLPRDWARWTEVATKDIGLESPIKLKPVTPASKGTWVIAGQIEGPLLIGAEGRSLQEDRAPWQETRVIWSGDNAFIHKDFTVIPATAIKGPIRHRTLFHLRRLQVADAEVANDDLFGSASNEEAGAAGSFVFLML